VANALDALDLPKGSAIAIDMPMNVNAVVIYLTIVLVGYVVVSIAHSFAAPAIMTMQKISEAKAIFTQVSVNPVAAEIITFNQPNAF
jgi:acyl-coenzyme A synthetase/AMP-(fatty) acid ligase